MYFKNRKNIGEPNKIHLTQEGITEKYNILGHIELRKGSTQKKI